MVSDAIQKQVDEIQGQEVRRLQELSLLVLSLTVVYFVIWWFIELLLIPYFLGLPDAPWIYLNINIIILTFTLAFLILVVSYLWWLRNKPQYRILFIERVEPRRQIDAKHVLTLLLVPASISLGLMSFLFFQMMYATFPALQTPLLISFFRSFGPFFWVSPSTYEHAIGGPPVFPLIVVVCLFALLYFAYRRTPERVQRSLPWVLFIPIIASISLSLYAIWWNLNDKFVVTGTGIGPRGLVDFVADITYFSWNAMLLASFILLFYLTCHYIFAEHRQFYTLATGEHLQGLIDEGVGILPARVRAGDSHSISLDLTLSKGFVKRASPVEDYHASSDYLEAELQAPGLTVDGDKQSRVHEISPLPVITWTCHFSASGNQTINLLIRVIKPNNSRHLVFRHHHTVKVNSLFSISWAPIVAFITPFLVIVVQVVLKLR